ncbi:MAG: OPT family oligopeptide transporter [Oligoflexales bacterium]
MTHEHKQEEWTPLAICTGIVIGLVMTAANIYLGLKIGMTVSASIPAAVMATAVFKILRVKGLHQSNIVQTMVSAGESLAAGVIFTIPALLLVGAWKEFEYITTTLIVICGGLLGIVFMIPLRKALIVDGGPELTYPEGVACARVLESAVSDGDEAEQGVKAMMLGVLGGGVLKVLGMMKLVKSQLEVIWTGVGYPIYGGVTVSPALLAVGYIVGVEVAVQIFSGGVIAWWILLPYLSEGMLGQDLLGESWAVWSTKVRYVGVGAMLVGGLWSVFAVRKGIADGAREVRKSWGGQSDGQDMSLMSMGIVLCFCLLSATFLFQSMLQSLGLALGTVMMSLLIGFPAVAVGSYICGLVGSSNNPVSGVTIAILVVTGGFFLALGLEAESGIAATLGVAAVVCCAVCTAADCSQDLKTGQLIGATPKYQQWAQMVGVVIPALIIAPTLTLLHEQFGLGEGLLAPQATLFASVASGLFGGSLQWDLLGIGACLALSILFIDQLMLKRRQGFRLHVMPVAVGLYLPMMLSLPILIGGFLRELAIRKGQKSEHHPGVLLGSGLIAGEALFGIGEAVLMGLGFDVSVSVSEIMMQTLTVGSFCAAISMFLWCSKE